MSFQMSRLSVRFPQSWISCTYRVFVNNPTIIFRDKGNVFIIRFNFQFSVWKIIEKEIILEEKFEISLYDVYFYFFSVQKRRKDNTLYSECLQIWEYSFIRTQSFKD